MKQIKIRECLFSAIANKLYRFEIVAKENGILGGVRETLDMLQEMDMKLEFLINEGESVEYENPIARGVAHPKAIIAIEEKILGVIGSASGVATAAHKALKIAGDKVKVVCGAWKKVHPLIKPLLRNAVKIVGMPTRITEPPFVYLDKNYIHLLGGIKPAVERAKLLKDYTIVVQLHEIYNTVQAEAYEALESGAHILMVDTGRRSDLKDVINIVRKNKKENIKVAFSGGIMLNEIQELSKLGANILDIGRAIVDTPMLDLSLDVKDKA